MKTIPITFLVSAVLLGGCDMDKKKVEAQPVQNMEVEESVVMTEPAPEPIIEETTPAVVPAPVPVERSVAREPIAEAEPAPIAYNESNFADESMETPVYEEQAMEDEWLNEEAQKQAMEDERVREFEAKTYNEQQLSDDADDYPIRFETDELTYNQRQFSY